MSRKVSDCDDYNVIYLVDHKIKTDVDVNVFFDKGLSEIDMEAIRKMIKDTIKDQPM